ncbi:MAG: hypothetical protein EOP04_01470, partial [Proteobacteria bacterium]
MLTKMMRTFLCLFVVTVLAIGFVSTLTGFDPVSGAGENRRKADLPAFPKTFAEIRTAIPLFDTWAADNFGFRNTLIFANNYLRVKVLGISPLKIVLLGKDDWLYLNPTLANGEPGFDDYRGLVPYTEDELNQIVEALESNQKAFEANNQLYVVAVAPSKHVVYPEFLPASNQVNGQPKTRMDQIMERLEGRKINLVDLRKSEIEGKSLGFTYFKTDTHWNSLGAFIGYQNIVAKLCELGLANCKIPDIADYSISTGFMPGGDLAGMLLMPNLYQEHVVNVSRNSANPPEKLGKMILLHDSFATAMRQYTDAQFEVTAIPYAANTQKISDFKE